MLIVVGIINNLGFMFIVIFVVVRIGISSVDVVVLEVIFVKKVMNK